MVRFGLGDELIATQSEEEAIASARDAVENGYDVVVAAGGDGSIGLVASELLGTETALGILPLGSIMNIPRMLDVPRDLEGAAEVLRDGHVRRIDVGESDGRPSSRRRRSGSTPRSSGRCPRSTRATTEPSSGPSSRRSGTGPPA